MLGSRALRNILMRAMTIGLAKKFMLAQLKCLRMKTAATLFLGCRNGLDFRRIRQQEVG